MGIKFVRDIKPITPTDTIETIPSIVLEWYKAGVPDSDIKNYIASYRPNYSQANIKQVVDRALVIFKGEYSKTRDHILAIHLSRYNRTMEELFNYRSMFRGKREIMDLYENYQQLLAVMKQKETLFGFHKKSFQVRILNIIKEKQQTSIENKFKISVLSDFEQLDFLQLLKKAKTSTEDEISNITLRSTTTEIQRGDYPTLSIEAGDNLSPFDYINELQPEEDIPNLSIAELTEKIRQTQIEAIKEAYNK